MIQNLVYIQKGVYPPLDAPTSFTSEAGNAEVSLTWTDPNDKYATPEGETAQDPDQLVSVWSHTVLVRKTGSQPAGPNDGTVVISSSVRNQYQSTPYVDTGLTNDTVYYYGVFAYNEDGVASPGAFTNATPVAGTPLSQLAEGTLIKILENGSPVEFYLAKHNYESGLNGEGRELVVRKDVHSDQVWDAGNLNDYIASDIDNWLRTTYVGLFSPYVQSLMGTTRFYVTGSGTGVSVGAISRPAFILSVAELGLGAQDSKAEGSELPTSNILDNTAQWTRTKDTSNTNEVWDWKPPYLYSDLARYDEAVCPCFTLPADTFIDTDLNLVES